MRSFFFASLALVLICASTTVSKPHATPAPSAKTNEKGCYQVCFVVVCINICPKAKNDENGAAVKWLNISVPIPDAISLPSFNMTNITQGEEQEE